jgi:hypothetical protein
MICLLSPGSSNYLVKQAGRTDVLIMSAIGAEEEVNRHFSRLNNQVSLDGIDGL